MHTDHNLLTYILTSAKLSATGHRWLSDLSVYEFDIIYRPGKNNFNVELLSSMEPREEEMEWQSVSQAGVKSICQRVDVLGPSANSPEYVEQLGATSDCISDVYAFPTHLQLNSLEQMSRQDLIAAQAQDPLMESTTHILKCGKWLNNPEVLPMKRVTGKLIMIYELLHHVSTSRTGEKIHQLVLPAKFKALVLKSIHADLGHLGVERVVDIIRSRFFWSKMSTDVEQHVKNCGECVLRKTPR